MQKKYDYLVVGAGLFGSVFAYEANKRGFSCLVIDKREHTGGNLYCESIAGINVHKYGAHIFHTNNDDIWDYMNQFAEFNRYTNSPLANYKGELYNLPFNMNTFNKLWGVNTPQEAKAVIENQKQESKTDNPSNLEEQAINLVGKEIYEKLIKGYTEKQWGRACTELPAFIIKRLPVRYTFDNNYFNDKHQGIPIGGYNKIFYNLLSNIDVTLNADFFDQREYYESLADKVVFTGMIDQFYDYKFGRLDYRSLRFEHKLLDEENFQGNAVVNYTDKETPYTRIIEHKHFEYGTQEKTYITYEYSIEHTDDVDPYYPINDEKNNERYELYKQESSKQKNYLFGGRLAEYKYYDMHVTVERALQLVKDEFE